MCCIAHKLIFLVFLGMHVCVCFQVCVCVCMCVYICECMCVCMRERKKKSYPPFFTAPPPLLDIPIDNLIDGDVCDLESRASMSMLDAAMESGFYRTCRRGWTLADPRHHFIISPTIDTRHVDGVLIISGEGGFYYRRPSPLFAG